MALKSRVIESALAGEMEHHLNNNQNHLLSDDLLPMMYLAKSGHGLVVQMLLINWVYIEPRE